MRTRRAKARLDAATLAFWSGGGNLLTSVAEDALLLRIASFLASAKDLLALGLSCKRFATDCIAAAAAATAAAAGVGGDAPAVEQKPAVVERWSIVQEVARRWLTECTDQERGWVPRRDRKSLLGLMWELEVMRRGVVFGRSHGSITLSEGGSLATKSVCDFGSRAAASKVVMRAGRHYAQFTVVRGHGMYFGVIRPGWDVERGQFAHNVDSHCFYYTNNGSNWPGRRDWEGMEGAQEGDRIGLLLDLDQGTMTVYKNGGQLGVMATGLSGEYSWAVGLFMHGRFHEGSRTRIEAATFPIAEL
jgi:hypothetical protein